MVLPFPDFSKKMEGDCSLGIGQNEWFPYFGFYSLQLLQGQIPAIFFFFFFEISYYYRYKRLAGKHVNDTSKPFSSILTIFFGGKVFYTIISLIHIDANVLTRVLTTGP